MKILKNDFYQKMKRESVAVKHEKKEEMMKDFAIELSTTLTKIDIAGRISKSVELNKKESKNLVDIFFREISEILCSGEPVKLPGFGQFKVRNKPTRPGRNPKTGEAFEITARSVATFQSSQYLKKCVENGRKLDE